MISADPPSLAEGKLIKPREIKLITSQTTPDYLALLNPLPSGSKFHLAKLIPLYAYYGLYISFD